MFGSKNYVTKYHLAPLQKQIFQDVFNGSLHVNEREHNLINAAGGVTDTVVIMITQLEKVVYVCRTTHPDKSVCIMYYIYIE